MFGINDKEWYNKIQTYGSYGKLNQTDKLLFDKSCLDFFYYALGHARQYSKKYIPQILFEIVEDNRFNAKSNLAEMKVKINRGVFIECCSLYYNLPEEFTINDKETLFLFSLYFIIAHELGHLLYCHQKAEIEFPWYKQTRYGRCLEKDADCFAITILSSYVKLWAYKMEITEPISLLITLLRVINGVFLLTQTERDFKLLRFDEHPFTGFRVAYCINSMKDFFPSKYTDIDVCNYVGWMNNHIIETYDIDSKKVAKYWNKINKYIKGLNKIEDDWFSNVMYIVAKVSFLKVEGVDFPRNK